MASSACFSKSWCALYAIIDTSYSPQCSSLPAYCPDGMKGTLFRAVFTSETVLRLSGEALAVS